MWLILALSCAFLTATSDSISKVLLRRNDEYLVAWLRLVIGAPLLLAILFWIDIPRPDMVFFRCLLIMLPLEITAYILYMKAIKYSPLSLALPFLALTPVFIILSGQLILKESIGPLGVSGILLVVGGSYLLNIQTFHIGAFEPVRSIFKERGSVYMIMVAFLYSLTAPLSKLAINHSGPLFFAAVYFPILSVILTPLVIIRYRQGLLSTAMIKRDLRFFLLIGGLSSLAITAHCLGIIMTKAAYMITVKRLSIVFGVGYGWLLFKERHIANRLIAAALMVLGVVLIAIGG